MLFSLIIVNYRTPKITAAGLRSVLNFTNGKKLEIIVVDNGSGDGSPELLRAEFDGRIRIIENKTNAGFSAANNRGAAKAKGEYLFFLNSDTLIKNDIFTELEATIKKLEASRPDLGIFMPQLLSENGGIQNKAYGKDPSLFESLISKLKKIQPTKDSPATKNENEAIISDWVSGAALIIRRQLFTAVGSWDEKFFLYLEDADLCRRVREKGYKSAVLPNISVIHCDGQSFTDTRERDKYFYRSQDYYWQKYYGRTSLWLMKTIRWPYKFWRLNIKSGT